MKLVIQDTVRDGQKGVSVEGQCSIPDLARAISALIYDLINCCAAAGMDLKTVEALLFGAIEDGIAAGSPKNKATIINLTALRGGGGGGRT